MIPPDDLDSSRTAMGRYLRTSTTISGLLARAFGEKYLGLSWNHETYALLLKDVLGSLKGPAMKIGQILATVPDMVPAEYFQEFLQLQSSAPPMGWGFVRRRMRAELGDGWEALFQSFEKEAVAAASLGQVHRAVHPDGTPLACKLQYPDMASFVEADLKQLGLLCKLYALYGSALSTDHIQEEIRLRLYEELDYCREAKHMALFHDMLKEEAGVNLPRVYPELSTNRLLAMTWLEGKPFLQAQTLTVEKRQTLARSLFRAWYIPFYQYGILHGDPHLGNYTVQEEGDKLNLLDFGCIRVFPPLFVEAVLELYHALESNDEARAIHAYEAWGFKPMTKDLLHVLNLWARFLYGPLLEDRIRPIEETFSGHLGKEIAGKVHEELRKIGGISPPREFVFMDRAAVGIGSALIHLRVSMNWYQLFQELIEGFSTQALTQRQQQILVSKSVSV